MSNPASGGQGKRQKEGKGKIIDSFFISLLEPITATGVPDSFHQGEYTDLVRPHLSPAKPGNSEIPQRLRTRVGMGDRTNGIWNQKKGEKEGRNSDSEYLYHLKIFDSQAGARGKGTKKKACEEQSSGPSLIPFLSFSLKLAFL